MNSLVKYFSCMVIVVSLAACGTTARDRTLSGAGLGAGAGTVGAIIVKGNPITGAAIGAAAGAITGAVTDKDDVDMGEPLWR